MRKEEYAVHRVWRVVRRWRRGMANTLKMAEVYAIYALLERVSLLKTRSSLIAKDLRASSVWVCCAIMPPHRPRTEGP